jgi:hypothetical protein
MRRFVAIVAKARKIGPRVVRPVSIEMVHMDPDILVPRPTDGAFTIVISPALNTGLAVMPFDMAKSLAQIRRAAVRRSATTPHAMTKVVVLRVAIDRRKAVLFAVEL